MIRLLEIGVDESALRLVALAAGAARMARGDELAGAVEAIMTPALRAAAPVKTGALGQETAATIAAGPGPGQHTIVWTSTPYARFVVAGTGIYHRPDPHAEWDVWGLQVFTSGGQKVITMHTHHKGQHANPYPALTLAARTPEIRAATAVLGGAIWTVAP